ncbi:MAG: ABC transporter substrate-binding protein [Hydrogenophaga sp.]
MSGVRRPDGRRHWLAAGLACGTVALAPRVLAQAVRPGAVPTLRMAFIDPLSGPAADIGRHSLRSWEFVAEHLQERVGVRFRMAGFDNKGSPQESVNVLKVAIDQGFRYIVQGNGSGVTAALTEAIARHNQLRPDRAVLLINYAAMDPALTAERCSPWHFRIDADTSMKMRAMTRFMASEGSTQRVYLLNQNYAHGQQFARYFREEASREAPGLRVLGDELHSAFAIEDFGPHVQRIAASGAQAVVTGNWGADLRGLIRAMQAQGLYIPLWGYYPQLPGTPQLLAISGERLPVYLVATGATRLQGPAAEIAQAYRARHHEDLVVCASIDGIRLLAQAVHQAGSTDPLRVAATLAGLSFAGFNGPAQLRAQDHQLMTRVCVARWQRVAPDDPAGAEATGYGFVPVRWYGPDQIAPQPRCEMTRSAVL